MTQLQKFIQKYKARVDAKIHAYYNSFKKFICCDELPDFSIQYVDSRQDKNINYQAQVFPYKSPIILRYNIATLNENSEYFKYTLVHEFTHLYDYYIQSKNHDNDFIKRNLMLYTECHAVQIEILFCYHIVEKITDKAEIIKTDLIKILQLPYIKNKTYTTCVMKFIDNQNTKSFHAMKTSYMYSCGTSLILSQLLNKEMNFMDFEKPYDGLMIQARNLLSNIKYNEAPSENLLTQLGNINEELNLLFYESQKNITNNILLKDISKTIPKCPTCGSTNLSKISNIGKAAKVGLFGIFGAGDLGKTWKCNSCGSKW